METEPDGDSLSIAFRNELWNEEATAEVDEGRAGVPSCTRGLGDAVRPLYIFDLCGTLSLIDHRLPILSDESLDMNTRWRKFFAECVHDRVNRPMYELLRALYNSNTGEIWIWSGRSKEVWIETCRWLFDNGFDLFYSALKMREEHDHTPDNELKEKWLNEMAPEDRARLVCVFEDRKSCVQMYRRNGITCLQCADGDF